MQIILYVSLVIGLTQSWLHESPSPVLHSKCITRNSAPGTCKLVRDCPPLLQAVRHFTREFWPQPCGFEGKDPKACCPDTDQRPSEQACRKFEDDFQAGLLQIPTTTAAPGVFKIQVFNGEEAATDSHPHMVALGYQKDQKTDEFEWQCGGTLISDSYALTAAHCVANLGGVGPVVVWVGAHDLNAKSEGKIVPIDEFIVHPLHTPTSHYHDIALLKVKNIVLGKDAFPACLYGLTDDPFPLEVLGWGATDQDAVLKSNTLQKAYLQSVPQDRCNRSYVSPARFPSNLQGGIIETQICAEGVDGKADSCLGDSGGPLQTIRTESSLLTIVGITSFGQLQFCGTVGVYTRVASYLDWIESIVWPQK